MDNYSVKYRKCCDDAKAADQQRNAAEVAELKWTPWNTSDTQRGRPPRARPGEPFPTGPLPVGAQAYGTEAEAEAADRDAAAAGAPARPSATASVPQVLPAATTAPTFVNAQAQGFVPPGGLDAGSASAAATAAAAAAPASSATSAAAADSPSRMTG